MSVNILRYFEGREIRDARQKTADLKLLVMMAKRDQTVAEEQLRKKVEEAKKPERMPIAGSLIWRGSNDDV